MNQKSCFLILVFLFGIMHSNSQITEHWASRYTGPAISNDESNDIFIDNSGNIYVTGSGVISMDGRVDYITIKYNSSGVQQWLQTYGNSLYNNDMAYAVTADNAGNVYVTGTSFGTATFDIATVKYNSAGVQQWASRYNSPSNNYDKGTGISIDNSGNVYVTGSSIGSGTDTDYVTIKYNSAGTEQWVQRYNGPSNGTDIPYAIWADNSGNVYVTGGSSGSAFNSDYLTIKYNSSGTPQWIQRYNGSAGQDDAARSLVVDANGNVYVTGNAGSAALNQDFYTIKYNSAGVQQWASNYDNIGLDDYGISLAVDNSQNVYVTGYENSGPTNGFDYATVKYNAAGVQQWKSSYSGLGNGNDKPVSVSLDGSGNVYVSGSSIELLSNTDFTTIKYNSAGVQQWINIFTGPADNYDNVSSMVTDVNGNVFVTGTITGWSSYTDFATIKLNTSGSQQWSQFYGSLPNSTDYASSMEIDKNGNIFVIGTTFTNLSGNDFSVIKYNSAGNLQWEKLYNGTANSSDNGKDITIDNSGNVYAIGQSLGQGGNTDVVIIKYSNSGSFQWEQRYNGPGNFNDLPVLVKTDNSGNVYVGATTFGSGTNYDLTLIKYNSSGALQWSVRYNGTAGSTDNLQDMVIDNNNDIYVTGDVYSTGMNKDYITLKYSSGGNLIWAKLFNRGPGNTSEFAKSVTVDNAGFAYVTGSAVTIKYNASTGDTLWTKSIPGEKIIFTSNSGIYIMAVGSGSNGADYQTIKINSGGVQQWLQTYNGPGNGDDTPQYMAADDSGSVYITGLSWASPADSFDYATVKYDVNGILKWEKRYNGPSHKNDYAVSVKVDSLGSVYITGTSYDNNSLTDFVTVKYSSLLNIEPVSNEIPVNFILKQNYPNPFNPTTKIRFQVPERTDVKITVFDILGKEISVLVNSELKPGAYETDWDGTNYPSGVYYYKFTSGDFIHTKKMVLIK